MTVRSIRQHIDATGGLRTGWLALPEPLVAELCLRAGFEALLIDIQHGMIDMASAFSMIGAIKGLGGFALARIPVGEYQSASRLLDWGADAVIAPMINTTDDARAFASFMKYPPHGERSWGPTRATQLWGLDGARYREVADGATLAIVMIETRAALQAIDDILAVPGIDGVFCGPNDLSASLSATGEFAPDRADTLAAMAHVAARTRAAGKIACAYGASPEHVKRYGRMGFHFSTLMSDTSLLTAGIQAALAEVARKD